MSTEKMREEFEAWVPTNDLLSWCTLQMLDDRYRDIDVHTAWESWKASRAMAKVVMPRVIYWGSSESMEGYDAEEIKQAIESLGLRVRS